MRLRAACGVTSASGESCAIDWARSVAGGSPTGAGAIGADWGRAFRTAAIASDCAGAKGPESGRAGCAPETGRAAAAAEGPRATGAGETPAEIRGSGDESRVTGAGESGAKPPIAVRHLRQFGASTWVGLPHCAQRTSGGTVGPGSDGFGAPQCVHGCWVVITPLPQLTQRKRALVGMGSVQPQLPHGRFAEPTG